MDYSDAEDEGLARSPGRLESADLASSRLIVTSILAEFSSAELPFSQDSQAQDTNDRKRLRCPNLGHGLYL